MLLCMRVRCRVPLRCVPQQKTLPYPQKPATWRIQAKKSFTWCYSLNDVHYSSSFQTPFVVLVCCGTSTSYHGTSLVVLWFVFACLFVFNLKLEFSVCQGRRDVLAREPWSLEVVSGRGPSWMPLGKAHSIAFLLQLRYNAGSSFCRKRLLSAVVQF